MSQAGTTDGQDHQMAWIERLRQLRRDRARRAEQDSRAVLEAAARGTQQCTEQLAQWEQQIQMQSQSAGALAGASLGAAQLAQWADRQRWMDQELQRMRRELARAEHHEHQASTATREAARHALRQSVQYEKVVEWRKSI